MKGYRGIKSLEIPTSRIGRKGWAVLFTWEVMPYGKERRKLILQHLIKIRKDKNYYYIPINRKHCIILKKDPDLRKLLKQGKVKMIKVRYGYKQTMSAIVVNEENI